MSTTTVSILQEEHPPMPRIADLTKKTGGNLVDGTDYSKAWSAIVLLFMIVFVASYATGLGNVPWQQGELFGLEGQFQFLFFLNPIH